MNRLEYIKRLKQSAIDFVRLTDYNIQRLESIDNEEFVSNITEYLRVLPVPKTIRDRIIELEEINYSQQEKICELSNKLGTTCSALFLANEANKKSKAQANADALKWCETVATSAKETDAVKKEIKNLQKEFAICFKQEAAEKEELIKRNADLSKKIEQYELVCSKLIRELSISDLEGSIKNLKYLIHE